MMKLFLVLALSAIAAADVSHLFKGNKQYQPLKKYPGQEIPILRSVSNINPDGSYDYAYETGNGIAAQEQGYQRGIGQDSANTVQGSFQYTSPEGVPVVVQYVADENGFQPQSDILPTPPPIPAAILRALEWNAAHPEPQPANQLPRFKF